MFIGKHNNVHIGSLKDYSTKIFEERLLATDWSSVLFSDNVSEAWKDLDPCFCQSSMTLHL